ncbi:MAG TPA: magnesium transporter [Pseudomonadales bacterium]|nr:magnesium transporter [Pseudomonadales bacterium]
MSTPESAPQSLQENLEQVTRLLQRHRLVESLVHKQSGPRHDLIESLVHKQHLAEIQSKLDKLHPADVAYILEALPLDDRLFVWELVKADRDGEILLEVSDAVRESLIKSMDRNELIAAAETLDTDELADLAPDLPRQVMREVLTQLDTEERAQLQSAMSYEEDQVGAIMDFSFVSVRPEMTLEVALQHIRTLGDFADHTDKLFVLDKYNVLLGVLSLKKLVLNDPATLVSDVMAVDVVTFNPEDDAAEAALAFERYDLISAPVVDTTRKMVGRLTVATMMDVIREESESDVLALSGLREEEDLFASVWASAKNRWLWLGINLITAFIASRVIGLFEGTIANIVELAALMPIVSGIGGNTGTQTTTLIIRGIALGQINDSNHMRLLWKELGIAILNGIVWGSLVGFMAFLLYGKISLGVVMTSAMVLNLLVAALVGFLVPVTMQKFGRDPAFGSGVLLTATTDSMGFFIFLGLATIFLL